MKDFNIMTSRQLCTARVSSVRKKSADPVKASTLDVNADILLVYVIDGELAVRGPEIDNLNIPSGHLCIVRDPARGSLHCRGASYIATQITHHP